MYFIKIMRIFLDISSKAEQLVVREEYKNVIHIPNFLLVSLEKIEYHIKDIYNHATKDRRGPEKSHCRPGV